MPDCTRDPEGLALLTACKENPLDLAPRLILTDWLEDHGEDDVARCLRESMAGDGCMVPLPTRAQERWQPLNGCDHGWLCLRPVAETVERKLHELRDCPWFGAVSLAAMPIWLAQRLIHGHPALAQPVRLAIPGCWSQSFDRKIGKNAFANLATLMYDAELLDANSRAQLYHDGRLLRLAELVQVGKSQSEPCARSLGRAARRNKLRTLKLSLGPTTWDDLRTLLTDQQFTALVTLALRGANHGDRVLHRLIDGNVMPRLRELALEDMGVSVNRLQTVLDRLTNRQLSSLHLSGNGFGDSGLEVLATWQGLEGITTLRLANVRTAATGFVALGKSMYASRLQSLDVSYNRQLYDLEDSFKDCDLPNLTQLNMSECELRGFSIHDLVKAPCFARVTDLNLSYNRIGDNGAHFLSQIPNWRVRNLNLAQNFTTEEGLWQLVRVANWSELRQLNMSENGIRGDCLQMLESWQPASLETLSLSRNPLDDPGLRAIADWPALARLRELTLAQVNASDAGLRALLDSPHLGPLESLNLWGNQITDAGADMLANCEALETLTDLYVSEEHLTDKGKTALRNSPHLRHTIIHW